MTQNPLTNRPEFTWRRPKEIIESWRGNRKVLPRPTDQKDENTCIGRAIVATMQAKLNIQAHRNGEPAPPKLSTQQLVDVQKRIQDPNKRTTRKMISWVMRNGIVAAADYDRNTQRADPSARRYCISSWEYVNPLEDGFAYKLKDRLTESPVLAEIRVHDDYDKTGRTELLYKAEGEISYHRGVPIGHAIVFTGWGHKPDNTMFWEYLNSYGVRFGRDGGFGEVQYDRFYLAYAIGPITWRDPIPPRSQSCAGPSSSLP